MGRRGPPRKPTALLEASGATKLNPARYADRASEPKPELLEVDKGKSLRPSFLTKYAAEYWDDLVKLLSDSRVLSTSDTVALVQLAEAWGEWRDAHKKVRVDGSKIPSEYRRWDKANDRLLKTLREFGMTPASRSLVQAIPKPPDANKFERMNGARPRGDDGDGD